MEKLVNFLEENGIEYTDEMIEKLSGYMEGVLSWNQKVNLTAITDRDEFVKKHYIDSLAVMLADDFAEAESIIDVGTGGGFPGIPLAVLCPGRDFVLMDSLLKRLKIIDELCEELKISNVKTLHMRAEDAGKAREYREKFDLCISRAVANMSTLSELCLPLVKPGGRFIAYKSSQASEELAAAEKAVLEVGGGWPASYVDVSSATGDDHLLAVISKEKETRYGS